MSFAVRAEWVAPIDSSVLRDGAVVFGDGVIQAVGPARLVLSAHPDAQVQDLGSSLALPGLVNAHTHLELSDCRAGASAAGSFTDWILDLPRRIGRDSGRKPEELFEPAVRHGVEQCLRFGVTSVGDISQQMHLTRPVLNQLPIRCVSYGEVLGLARRRWRYEELRRLAVDRSCQTDRLRIGLSPHAPYSVDVEGYRQCLELARQQQLPLATHLAETPAEREFLESHSGPFRELWDRIDSWEDNVPTYQGSPVGMAKAIGLLDYPTLLAHVNYCDDSELAMLARGRASVVYCPRTHAYFRHPPHRWREMLAAGINVAVGTDSCASSPDLNLVDELRLLRKIAPGVAASKLWEMATIRAARALMMDSQVGSLARGKRADLVAFEVTGQDPLEQLLQSNRLPSAVWIDGVKV